MISNSFPYRSSMSPFNNKSNNGSQTIDEGKLKNHKKRQSLQIITSSSSPQQQQQDATTNKKVRTRLSSLLFRTSSPVVMTLKETFSPNKRASLSTVSFSKTTTTEEEEEEEEDSQSTTTTLSSNSSDHMPASPTEEEQQRVVWQPSVTVLSYHHPTSQLEQETKEIQHQRNEYYKSVASAATLTSVVVVEGPVKPSSSPVRESSLAYQVQEILGSTLEEVDEEIDQDWEKSRSQLHQSLVPLNNNNRQQWIFS